MGRRSEAVAHEVPPALLHAGDRNRGDALRSQQEGAVGDAVLLCSQELLPIQDEDGPKAVVRGFQCGDATLPNLPNGHHP